MSSSAADVGGGAQVVDDAGVGRAARGDDGEQSLAVVRRQGVDRPPHCFTVEPAAVVGGDAGDVGVHRPRRLDDGRVGATRRQQQPTAAIVDAACSLPPPPASGNERAEVPGRAAADEHAAGIRGHPGEVGDPPQRLVLGEDRAAALQPRPAVDARGADDEVEQDRRCRRCRRHEGQEPWVVDGDARRGEDIAEDPQRLEPADAGGRDRLAGRGAQLGERARAVERRRFELHPPRGVVDDRLGELGHPLVASVHGRPSQSSNSSSSLPSLRASASPLEGLAEDRRGDAAGHQHNDGDEQEHDDDDDRSGHRRLTLAPRTRRDGSTRSGGR